MNIFDALTFTRDYLDRAVRDFTGFFGASRSPEEGEGAHGQVAASALLYLVVGVTLQDSYVSGLQTAEIRWLDRALSQIVFWVTIALLIALFQRLFGSRRGGAMLVAFRVLPMAFLCGAYAASIGYFLGYVIRIVTYVRTGYDAPYSILPSWLNLLVQLAVVGAYLPRELRARCGESRPRSRLIGTATLAVVLLIDSVAILGLNFLPPDATGSHRHAT